jgi:hypothetical protein
VSGDVGAGASEGAGQTLGRRRIDAGKEVAILADLRSGKAGIVKLAGLHGVGVGTVQRIKAAMADCARSIAQAASTALGDSLAGLTVFRLPT